MDTLRHFCGHLDLPMGECLTLCGVSNRSEAAARQAEVEAFVHRLRRAGAPPCGQTEGLID